MQRFAVPSVAIPYGQRYINVKLASRNKLFRKQTQGYDYVNSPLLTNRSDVFLSDADHNVWNSNFKSEIPLDITLYINNLFVNPEIHEIFIQRVGFNLIRVHRRQVVDVTKSADELLLNELKWPIETLYVGMRPKHYNATNSSQQSRYLDYWNCFHLKTVSENTVGRVCWKS